MEFFDRKYEVSRLEYIRKQSEEKSQFTIITGRRRIGKTSLVLKSLEDEKFLYFFVSRKSESELCEDFQREITEKLNVVSLGRVSRFQNLFEFIMTFSKNQQVTLFIDEFQEFARVNKSIFSDMQRIWDLNKNESKMNLIVCGSVNSMMNKLFKDDKEPLFGRQTHELNVKPFATSVIKEILSSYNPDYSNEDLLALYAFTGGVAKYVEHFIDNKAYSKEDMINLICRRDSIFLNEGKNTLIEEFGRDYGIYFSILSAIASGRTKRSEIEDVVGKEIGGYLTKLENDYNIIQKKQPLFEKSSSNNVRYKLFDNFYIFWFRFIYKYNYMIEIGAYEKLKSIILRDYEVFSGLSLEKYFTELLKESEKYTRIGGWWNRKGEDEIDIIAEDEISQSVTFFEVKRQHKRLELGKLEDKKNNFLAITKQYRGYEITCQGLSIDDM